jgi:hypothetical protein
VTSGCLVATDWPDLQPDTAYQWCVRVTDETGKSVMGPLWSFRTLSEAESPQISGPNAPVVSDPVTEPVDPPLAEPPYEVEERVVCFDLRLVPGLTGEAQVAAFVESFVKAVTVELLPDEDGLLWACVTLQNERAATLLGAVLESHLRGLVLESARELPPGSWRNW